MLCDDAQIRVMPNTPCLIGQAASAYVLGNNATGEDAEKVFALISSCGKCCAAATNVQCAIPAPGMLGFS